jgi:hypothetical protein
MITVIPNILADVCELIFMVYLIMMSIAQTLKG